MTALHATDDVLHAPCGDRPLMLHDETIDPRPVRRFEEGRRSQATLGASRGWQNVLTRAAKVAPTEATACLSG